jgi:diguanylate cyclase (GGDEF)-like protein/PAS domain S-box-containing protein
LERRVSEPLDNSIYRTVLEGLATGVYLVDRDRKILVWNDGAERISGYLRHEVIGRFCHDNILMHCDENHGLLCGVACPLAATIHDGRPRTADVFLRHKGGQLVPVRVHAAPIRDARGVIIGAAESFDERIVSPEEEAPPDAGTVHDCPDDLTNLPNAGSMKSHAAAILEDFTANHNQFGIMTIAIDKLDEIQRNYGYKAVESVVRVTARTLSNNLRPADVLGRWSGQRFLAIVTNCPAAALVRVGEILKRLVSLAAVPWWGDRISVTISIGAAAARAGDTVEALLARSEEALNTSLKLGGDHVAVY